MVEIKIATYEDIIDVGGEIVENSSITLNQCVTKENISLFTNVSYIGSSSKQDNQLITVEEFRVESSEKLLVSIRTNFSRYEKGSGGSSPVTITATYSDGSKANVTSSCTATIINISGNGNVASWNSNTCIISHGVVGTAKIEFSYTESGITRTTAVDVETVTVIPLGITLSPSSLSLGVGESATVSASMELNNGYTGGSFEIEYIFNGQNYITASLSDRTITVTGKAVTPNNGTSCLAVIGTYNGVTITTELVVEVH